ncbi:hypothetical protein [Cellulomonas aerilata]|uniref:Uncharacterized protein n=1 Tax=Cellulomonas aerilata TaxID=515326 RepID=A0A512D9C6_9CELL|nr:hypothetical protein [Cellulomonas aerilata]GEO33069.1 hypothetical protein CAE01nite_07940 [Cellulomonas aerilata]
MADANERMQAAARRDDVRGDKDLTEFTAVMDELDREWMRVARWPRSVVTTKNRLARLTWARTARDRGDRLYCWHGPAVPQYIVVSGTGGYPG